METKLSVIIPAYNTEKTIRRCLDSLIVQIVNRQDIEIIIVNDGSNDETGIICEEYTSQYSFIKYISISRKGVSYARNTGLEAAEGKYITFVDSDDYVSYQLMKTIDEGTEEDWDLYILGMRFEGSDKGIKILRKPIQSSDEEETAKYLSCCLRKQLLNTVYGKLFKRELIQENDIRFPDGLQIGEDKVFMLSYVLHTKTVKSMRQHVYVICVDNNESLSRKRRDDLCDSVLKEHQLLSSLTEQVKNNKKIYNCYKNAVCYSFYRSAYSVVRELNKYELDEVEKLDKTGAILSKYCEESKNYDGFATVLMLGLPVRLKAKRLVNRIVNMADFNL